MPILVCCCFSCRINATCRSVELYYTIDRNVKWSKRHEWYQSSYQCCSWQKISRFSKRNYSLQKSSHCRKLTVTWLPTFMHVVLKQNSYVLMYFCFRVDRCGDFHRCVCLGDNGQIHLQQERDVSKPRSQSNAAWRWPWVPLQQPGGLPECSHWKPKGVFHLAGSLTSHWPYRTERDDLTSAQGFTWHTEPFSPGTSGSTRCEVKQNNSWFSVFPFCCNFDVNI